MSDLREQFEKETQNQAIYRKFGIDYHTLKYVKWLESQLTQLQSKWNKLNTRPNDAKAMIAEGFVDECALEIAEMSLRGNGLMMNAEQADQEKYQRAIWYRKVVAHVLNKIEVCKQSPDNL